MMSNAQHNTTVSQTSLDTYVTNDVEYETGIFYAVDVDSIPQAKAKADELAKDMGSLRGSIENGDGNYAGLLAEVILANVIEGRREATYEYDLIANYKGGYKVDMKTKRRTVPPKGYYEVSIADWNTEQECNWYYFTSYNTEAERMWFCGFMEPENYYEKAVFHEEGDYDPDNDFTFKADCYNLTMSELKQPSCIAQAISEYATEVCKYD